MKCDDLEERFTEMQQFGVEDLGKCDGLEEKCFKRIVTIPVRALEERRKLRRGFK